MSDKNLEKLAWVYKSQDCAGAIFESVGNIAYFCKQWQQDLSQYEELHDNDEITSARYFQAISASAEILAKRFLQYAQRIKRDSENFAKCEEEIKRLETVGLCC